MVFPLFSKVFVLHASLYIFVLALYNIRAIKLGLEVQ